MVRLMFVQKFGGRRKSFKQMVLMCSQDVVFNSCQSDPNSMVLVTFSKCSGEEDSLLMGQRLLPLATTTVDHHVSSLTIDYDSLSRYARKTNLLKPLGPYNGKSVSYRLNALFSPINMLKSRSKFVAPIVTWNTLTISSIASTKSKDELSQLKKPLQDGEVVYWKSWDKSNS